MLVAHLTSAHTRGDTRIFIKECSSLIQHSFDTSLIVADGMKDENINGLAIYDVGKCKNRIDRILNTTKRVYRKAIELDADIYHIHDPQLIPVGLKLK